MEGEMIRARIELESTPDVLGFARVAAASFASILELSIDRVDDIKLAVSEAVSNCIVHAYPDSIGPIVMTMQAQPWEFRVCIEDNGVGIEDIPYARTPGNTCDPTRMGMGFTLMEALSDVLEVTSQVGSGTCVTMLFRVAK